MNGTEQRQHTTAVRSIGRRQDDVETLLVQLGAEVIKNRADASAGLAREHAKREALADEYLILRNRLDALTNDQNVRQQAWDQQTLWQRLCWLARG
jgi:hypothetical protein